MLLYEFKTDLNKYFASLKNDRGVRSLQELIEFNEANKDAEMPYFGSLLNFQDIRRVCPGGFYGLRTDC